VAGPTWLGERESNQFGAMKEKRGFAARKSTNNSLGSSCIRKNTARKAGISGVGKPTGIKKARGKS